MTVLEFKPPIGTMKLPAIKLVDMWTSKRRFFVYSIPYSRTSSHCYTFGSAFGEWTMSLFHLVECWSTRWSTRSENINESLCDLLKRSVFPDFTLLRDGTLLHLERFNEETSTPKAGPRGSWTCGCAFYWCVLLLCPKNEECFYLWMLLVSFQGPTSFESLQTVNDIVCQTFRAACQDLNLLEKDNH